MIVRPYKFRYQVKIGIEQIAGLTDWIAGFAGWIAISLLFEEV
jgi:hypothetical protein